MSFPVPRLPIARSIAFLLVSAGVAWAANALRTDGLELGRDYFPTDAQSQDGNASEGERVPYRFIELAEAKDLWQYREDAPNGGIYFIDARRPASFASGHIPGAHEVDPYGRMADFLPDDFVQRLRNAMYVVVYCTGGQCEDSRSVAHELFYGYRIPKEVLTVFEGGIEEWKQAGLPIEKDASDTPR